MTEPGADADAGAKGRRAASALAAVLVARAAFGLAFLAVAFGRLRVPAYLPVARRWTMGAAAPDEIAMQWFGATTVALAVAGLAYAAVRLVARRRAGAGGAFAPDAVLALAHAAALVLLVDFAYFGWAMSHQTPPADLAPGVHAPREAR